MKYLSVLKKVRFDLFLLIGWIGVYITYTEYLPEGSIAPGYFMIVGIGIYTALMRIVDRIIETKETPLSDCQRRLKEAEARIKSLETYILL